MKRATLLLGSACCIALTGGAFAEQSLGPDTQGLSFESILSTMNSRVGSTTTQVQVAPTSSELFGLGIRATVGTYVSEEFALGVIIDYAEYRKEYLANAGVRLSDNIRVVGSVGILKQQEEFIQGGGREAVRQLEYGLSLKGNYDAGIVRGFEVNTYATTASSDTDSAETGDLTGAQVVTQLQPADSTNIRIGAGYEQVEWASGEEDEGFTLQALGSQKLSDNLSMTFDAKSAATENVYGLGFTYDMSNANFQNSALSIDLMRVEGKQGISDDTRVALNWTVGFGEAGGAGASSDATVSSKGYIARADLLADVMTRPAFLPQSVIARANGEPGLQSCSAVGVISQNISTGAVDQFVFEPGLYAAIYVETSEPTVDINGVIFTGPGNFTTTSTDSFTAGQSYTMTVGTVTCSIVAFLPPSPPPF